MIRPASLGRRSVIGQTLSAPEISIWPASRKPGTWLGRLSFLRLQSRSHVTENSLLHGEGENEGGEVAVTFRGVEALASRSSDQLPEVGCLDGALDLSVPSNSGVDCAVQGQSQGYRGVDRTVQSQSPGFFGVDRTVQSKSPGFFGVDRTAQGQSQGFLGVDRTVQGQSLGFIGVDRTVQGQSPGFLGVDRTGLGQSPGFLGVDRTFEGEDRGSSALCCRCITLGRRHGARWVLLPATAVAGADNSGWTDIGPRSAFATSLPGYNPLGQSGPTIGHPPNVDRQQNHHAQPGVVPWVEKMRNRYAKKSPCHDSVSPTWLHRICLTARCCFETQLFDGFPYRF